MNHQFCTFRLDRLLFGVPVLQVQEVIRPQQMTRVPLAPPAVRGLINLRGQIVTAIDLRQRLELPAPDREVEAMNVVVRTADGAVSFLVDEVGEVVEVADDDRETPPETLRGAARELTQGVFKLHRELLLVLDSEQASTVAGDN